MPAADVDDDVTTPCPVCPVSFATTVDRMAGWWDHVTAEHPATADRLRAAVARAEAADPATDWTKRHTDGLDGKHAPPVPVATFGTA